MSKLVKNILKFSKSATRSNLKIISIDSKIRRDLNLCKIVSYGKFNNRANITESNQIMQVSLIQMSKSQLVPRHKHLPIERCTVGTGEGWLVLEGCFEAEIFDIDQVCVGKYLLKKLDILIMFNGGHSLNTIEENSIMCEFKNGPFQGSDSDKIYF